MTFATPIERRDVWIAIGVATLAAVAYAMTIGYDFVYDDARIMSEHEEFRSLSNWREILSTTWWPAALYRPFSQLSLALDWAVSGGRPSYFHAVNVLLHAVVSVAVFFLARLGVTVFCAAVAALLFAVHPVHVEAVANVVGRAEMFATLFATGTALLYYWDGELSADGDRSWRRGIASGGTLAFLVLGLASKESAFATPGILLIVDWLGARHRGEILGARLRRHAVLWFASLVLTIEWLMLRSLVIGDYVGDSPGPGLYGEGFFGRFWVMAPVVLQYARLFIFPLHLSADYSPNYLPAIPSVTVPGILGLLVLGVAVALAWVARRAAPMVTFSLAWMGGTLLVVSNLIVPTGVLLAERSMYLPSVGFALIVGWLAGEVRQRMGKRMTLGLVGAVLILATARSVTRMPVWRDADTFFPRLVQDAPGSYRGMWLAGMIWYNVGERERGERLLRLALSTSSTFPNTWHDFGTRLQEDERWLEAAQVFGAAFRLDERRLYDAASAATNYVRAGKLDSAAAIVARGRSHDPHYPRLLMALGDIAAAEGRYRHAMTWRRQAARLAPEEPNFWLMTADAAIRAEYCPEVIRSIERLRALEDSSPHLEPLEERSRLIGCYQ